MDYQEHITALGLDLCVLTDKYEEHLPPYEVVFRMIAHAVSMSLCCAPNELLGVKTILASVEMGIKEYEENHS